MEHLHFWNLWPEVYGFHKMGVFIDCWKRNPLSLQISEGLRIIFDYRFQLEAIIHFHTLGTGVKAFLKGALTNLT